VTRARRSIPACCCVLLATLTALGQTTEGDPDPVGRPKLKQGQLVAVAVWYDAKESVWHLWTTSPAVKGGKASRVIFAGSVRVTGDRVAGEFDKLERTKRAANADYVLVHRDGRGFDFQFATFGGADGVKFKAGAKAQSIRFKLLAGGVADPARVVIGAAGAHPKKADFTLPAHPGK
jgi:hypothetical protein